MKIHDDSYDILLNSLAPKVAENVQNVNLNAPKVAEEQETSTTVQNVNLSTRKHPCPTCFRVYTRSNKLLEHLPKCTGASSVLECLKCHAVFSCKYAKYKHCKQCNVNESTPTMSVVNNNSNSHNHINTQNNIQTQNNQINININGLGKEDMRHLTPDFLERQALKHFGRGILSCIEHVHFHPDHPENHNLRAIANHGVSKKTIAVYDDTQWKKQDAMSVMRDLIQTYSMKIKDRLMQREVIEKIGMTDVHIMIDHLNKVGFEENPNVAYSVLRNFYLLLERVESVIV